MLHVYVCVLQVMVFIRGVGRQDTRQVILSVVVCRPFSACNGHFNGRQDCIFLFWKCLNEGILMKIPSTKTLLERTWRTGVAERRCHGPGIA